MHTPGTAIMPAELRVMSFNIRYGTADDGENNWLQRRELVVRAIQRFGPDLLGTQEGVDFQIEYLRKELADYTFVGAPREDGRQAGEYVAIFFRTQRFSLIDMGHFWLSETPHAVGSKSWDSRLPRMVTWCELCDLSQPVANCENGTTALDGLGGPSYRDSFLDGLGGPSDKGSGIGCSPDSNTAEDSIFFFNTHFDMRGEVARLESAKLLRQRIDSLGADCRIVLTGDFNCSEDDAPYRTLLFGSDQSGPGVKLVDAFRSVHPMRGNDELTRHEFRMGREGLRIDWIIHSGRFQTFEATIEHENVAGRYPSDHFPVTAVLRPV